jgi:DNA-binding beta-propeller fold protein YncE
MFHDQERTRPISISSRIESESDIGRGSTWIGEHAISVLHPCFTPGFMTALLVAISGCGTGATRDVLQSADEEPRIYVADWANHRIVRMNDMRGNGWLTCNRGGEGQGFHYPVGICMDAAGRIYVSEQYHHRIVRLDDVLGTGWAAFSPPDAATKPVNKFAGSWICVDSRGRIYITYDGEHRIARMDDMSGANRVALGSDGSGVGQFRYPAGIAVDDAGRVYVADFDNFRIVRVDDMQGSNWTELGSYGSGEREFINPCGMCLDPLARIYVADQGNDRIVRIDDMQGTNWTTIGSFGTAPDVGRLYAPTGVCVDSRGRIYVTQSSSNHRIVRMDDMSGANWVSFGSGGTEYGQFASPMGICVR